MTTEQDVRAIYEGFFKIAEQAGCSSYTEAMSWQLHGMLTNPGIVNTERLRRVFSELSTFRIDGEYSPKFGNLASKQRKLEAQLQR